MAKATSTPPRISREELVEKLDANLDRLETEQAAQAQYGKLLQVLRKQVKSLAQGPAPAKPLRSRPAGKK